MCGVGSSIWEISAPSSQFPCEPTSTVKKKKKKSLSNAIRKAQCTQTNKYINNINFIQYFKLLKFIHSKNVCCVFPVSCILGAE